MKYLFLCVVFVVCGCKTTTVTPFPVKKTTALTPEAVVYISKPKDGYFETENYYGSGRDVAIAFKLALFPHTTNIIVASDPQPLEEALRSAQINKAEFLLMPNIIHWEERATEWSGVPDRIEVDVHLFSVASGSKIADATLTGKSSWFTFGGDHPQDLLEEPVKKLVENLYSK